MIATLLVSWLTERRRGFPNLSCVKHFPERGVGSSYAVRSARLQALAGEYDLTTCHRCAMSVEQRTGVQPWRVSIYSREPEQRMCQNSFRSGTAKNVAITEHLLCYSLVSEELWRRSLDRLSPRVAMSTLAQRTMPIFIVREQVYPSSLVQL